MSKTKHYPNYEDLCQMRQEGKITDVEFVRQISDEITNEYEDFCKDEGLDPERNESALAFLDFQDDLFEETTARNKDFCRLKYQGNIDLGDFVD